MIHKDKDALLAFCLSTEKCEGCGKRPPNGIRLEAHHCFISRGAGGSDFRCNAVAVCRMCHTRAENEPKFNRVLQLLIAHREKVNHEAIHDFLKWYRRQPKGMSIEQLIEWAKLEFSGSALTLALRELG